MTDEFDGIFDHLNPSDFHTSTTALHERPLAFSDDLFEVFLDHNLTAVRYAWAAADGDISSVATLANGAIERMFAPEGDETLRQYADRLHREAKLIRAQWLFVSVRTRVGTILTSEIEGQDISVGDQAGVDQADSMGSARDAVYWFAARRDDPESPRRHGFLIIEGANLGANVQGEVNQPVPAYDGILSD